MEQGRFSLTPRTQRRSQNFHSDVAKISIISSTSKFLASFLQIFGCRALLFQKISYFCKCKLCRSTGSMEIFSYEINSVLLLFYSR